MHLGELAAKSPDKAAYVIAESGAITTFKQLNDYSMQASQLFRKLGLNRGDHIAILLENHPAQLCDPVFTSRLFPTGFRKKKSSTSSATARPKSSSPPRASRGLSKSWIWIIAKAIWLTVLLRASMPGKTR